MDASNCCKINVASKASPRSHAAFGRVGPQPLPIHTTRTPPPIRPQFSDRCGCLKENSRAWTGAKRGALGWMRKSRSRNPRVQLLRVLHPLWEIINVFWTSLSGGDEKFKALPTSSDELRFLRHRATGCLWQMTSVVLLTMNHRIIRTEQLRAKQRPLVTRCTSQQLCFIPYARTSNISTWPLQFSGAIAYEHSNVSR